MQISTIEYMLIYQNFINSSVCLRPVKWVTLKLFLFSVHPYQPTLDFAFFILEWTIVKRIRCYIK